MKATTKDWFLAAEDDLLSAKKLIDEDRLTNIVAFHCQQCIEKSLKGIIEEQNLPPIKSHDLLRLLDIAGIQVSQKQYCSKQSMKFTLKHGIRQIWV